MAKNIWISSRGGGLVVRFLSVLLALGTGVSVARADTRNWTGAVNSNWSTAGNWSPVGTPQNGDVLVFPPSTPTSSSNDLFFLQLASVSFKTTHQVSGLGFTLTGSLTVNGPGDVLLSVPIVLGSDQTWVVSDQLDMHATIDLNGHTLTMNNSDGVGSTHALSGTGAVVKTGQGSWDITAQPSDAGFAGTLTIEQGRIWAIGPKSLGVEDGTEANGTTVRAGAALYLMNYSAGLNEAIELHGDGGSWAAALVFAAGAAQRVDSRIELATSATITTDPNGVSASTVTFSPTAAITGPGDLTILDKSTLVYESQNQHMYGITRFGGSGMGTLRLGQFNALSMTGGIDLAPAATLDLNGFETGLRSLSGSGTITSGLAPPGDLTINATADCTFTGTILSLNNLTKVGNGEFVFGATSAQSGNISVLGGTIRFTNANAFGTATGGTFVTAQGRVVLDGVSPGNEPFTLQPYLPPNAPTLHVTAAAPVVIGGSLTISANANAVISGAPGADLTINGRIVSASDLRISGLTLHATNGMNQFQTGTVTVDAGAVFDIAAHGAFDGILAGTGRVVANVSPAAYALKGTHAFTGTFEANAKLEAAATTVMPAAIVARGQTVSIESGATLGPLTLEGAAESLRAGSEASATGIVTGGLTLPAAAATKVWLTGTTPRITVNGSVHLAGTLTYGTSTQLPSSATLTLIDNDGTDPIVGTFANLLDGSELTISGSRYHVSYTGGTGNDLILSPIALMTYHLAEGATGTFFDTDLLIANPNGNDVVADVTFLPENGTPIVQQHAVPAMSRLTLRVDDVAGLEGASFSTIVAPRQNVPLIVERTMRWDATGYGGHTEKATAGPSTTWYFAEGSEGFFHTFLLLANPHATANVAHVQYLREGFTTISRSYDLLPSSRRTIAAGDDQGLIDHSFGMTVTFDQPGVAERAMYFGTSPILRGGHESAGVTATSTSWLLAEGATGAGFETFILVANPGSEASEVTFTFLPENGAPASITRTVAAASRLTINPEADGDPALANLPLGPLATQIAATKPVIAERAQYWPLGPAEWTEAHNSFGVTDAATRWGLAEGRAGGPEGYQTYVLLANPGGSDATVTLTFLGEHGGSSAAPAAKVVTVPAQRRVNVPIDPTGAAGDPATMFGALIVSDQAIVVERAMYWNVNGEVWAAGTNATATRLP
jgi:hypothetical protein